MRHFIDIKDFDSGEIEEILTLASKIVSDPGAYSETMRRKKIATLFFEPSTRTRLSFESAMLDLGGSVIGFSDSSSSSASKGESVRDTVKTVSCYCDVIVMRHPKEGAPLLASTVSEVPIINAGDGGHAHPTQTLTDLFTIKQEAGRFEGLTIGLCGDLKFGRTVHSLADAMLSYSGVKIIAISPDELKLPEYIASKLEQEESIELTQTNDLEWALPKLDVLYMTRVQRERFFNEEDYLRLKDSFIIDAQKMQLMKESACLMHPLPRVNEIAVEVDQDPRAAYFRQVKNGKFVRMALILKLLGGEMG